MLLMLASLPPHHKEFYIKVSAMSRLISGGLENILFTSKHGDDARVVFVLCALSSFAVT